MLVINRIWKNLHSPFPTVTVSPFRVHDEPGAQEHRKNIEVYRRVADPHQLLAQEGAARG